MTRNVVSTVIVAIALRDLSLERERKKERERERRIKYAAIHKCMSTKNYYLKGYIMNS